MESGEFHWTEGWYFKRLDDGSVRIRKQSRTSDNDFDNIAVATISALEWQSIVDHLKVKPRFCKHCPFAEHVHYEEDGKKVTPSCPGFEAA